MLFNFYGKQLRFITFIINVGGNIKETFVATPKKPEFHWTLLYVDTTQNKSFYCDTLGWAVPTDLTSTVNNILEALSSKLPFAIKPVQGRFLAHKPQSMGHGSHQCTNTCFQNIPLQKCGNVCGVIVIVMAAISCISPRLWRLGFLDVKKSLSSQEWTQTEDNPILYYKLQGVEAEEGFDLSKDDFFIVIQTPLQE